MIRAVQHGWGVRLRGALASWRRVLALLICVAVLAAAIHPAAADLAPARDGASGIVLLDGSPDPCGNALDRGAAHCCACQHQVAAVTFAPPLATPVARIARFAAAPSAAPAWPTNPPPRPPRT